MARNSAIEWTHHTFNPWRGCTKVSPGCANCYAEALSARNPKVLGEWGPDGKRVIAAESYWRQPLKWNKDAEQAGERRRVFCASLADFAEARQELSEPRMRLFRLIGQTHWLDWLLLTKRPEVALDNWALWAGYWASQRTYEEAQRCSQTHVMTNIWLGVSVEDQARADERIPLLLQTPAAVRFLSCEPLLGPVELPKVPGLNKLPAVHIAEGRGHAGVDWVIVGGESGPKARPCNVAWIRSILNQCGVAGVPPREAIRLNAKHRSYGPWLRRYERLCKTKPVARA